MEVFRSLEEVVAGTLGGVFLYNCPVERSQMREQGTWQESGLAAVDWCVM